MSFIPHQTKPIQRHLKTIVSSRWRLLLGYVLALTASAIICTAASAQDLRGPLLNSSGPYGPLETPSTQMIPFSVPTVKMTAPQNPLTLSATLNASFTQNPRMYAARTLLGISKAAYAQALVLPNPGIYLSNNYRNSYLIGVTIPLEPPWKLVFRILVARREIRQAHLDLEKAMWTFRGEVRRAYVELVMAEEIANARRQVRDLAGKIMDTAKTHFEAGDAPNLDVRRAKLAYLQGKMDADQADIQVVQSKEQLNLLMARDADFAVTVPKLPEPGKVVSNELLPDFTKAQPSREDYVKMALANRLDLKLARQSLSTNHAYLNNAYGNSIPTPRFVVGHLKELNPPDPPGPITNNAFFQAYVDLPVFNVNQGEIFRFKATIKQLEAQVPSLENQIAAQVSLAYQKVVAARKRIQTFEEEALSESETISRISQHGYDLGQLTLTSLLDAERSNIQMKSQFLDAVLAYHIAMNDLEQAVGTPLD